MTNKDYHLTPLLHELVETIRNIAADGQDVNFKNLCDRKPHHARRDYFKALEIYKDEQKQLLTCKLPMPEQIRKRSEALFQQCWAIISNYFDEQLNKEKHGMEESVKEARSARESAFDENEFLRESNEKLKAQILKLQQALDESNKVNEKLELYKRDLEFANKELQCKTEQQEKTLSLMKEIIDKLKSEKLGWV